MGRAPPPPGQSVALRYPGGRLVEITAARAASCSATPHSQLTSTASTVRISRAGGDGGRVTLARFDFGDFMDFAGAREARDALAAHQAGARPRVLALCDDASRHHPGWRPLAALVGAGTTTALESLAALRAGDRAQALALANLAAAYHDGWRPLVGLLARGAA